MQRNKRSGNIRFNWFSVFNLLFGLIIWFSLARLGRITFKSVTTLCLAAITIFLLRASFDLLLALFGQKDPAELRFKNAKHCGWFRSLNSDGWGVLAPLYCLFVVKTFFVVAIAKLEWFSIADVSGSWTLLVVLTSIAFEQYWYFYNDFPPHE